MARQCAACSDVVRLGKKGKICVPEMVVRGGRTRRCKIAGADSEGRVQQEHHGAWFRAGRAGLNNFFLRVLSSQTSHGRRRDRSENADLASNRAFVVQWMPGAFPRLDGSKSFEKTTITRFGSISFLHVFTGPDDPYHPLSCPQWFADYVCPKKGFKIIYIY